MCSSRIMIVLGSRCSLVKVSGHLMKMKEMTHDFPYALISFLLTHLQHSSGMMTSIQCLLCMMASGILSICLTLREVCTCVLYIISYTCDGVNIWAGPTQPFNYDDELRVIPLHSIYTQRRMPNLCIDHIVNRMTTEDIWLIHRKCVGNCCPVLFWLTITVTKLWPRVYISWYGLLSSVER